MLQKVNNPFSLSVSEKRPLILDGVLGSLLQKMGCKPNSHIWMTELNRTSPDLIMDVHKSYIKARADIITTNTFRTNLAAIEVIGISNAAPYVKEAVKLAKVAVSDDSIYIAGLNAPAEDCYQKKRNLSYKKLEMNYKIHIDLLIDNNVNFILNETQSHLDEITIICKHCLTNKLPYVLSFYFDNKLNILSGESLESVIKLVVEHDPLAIGINFIAPDILEKILQEINLDHNWGFYLNCGSLNYFDKDIVSGVDSKQYLKVVGESMKYVPSFIGACCGSTPDHIRVIKELLDGKNN